MRHSWLGLIELLVVLMFALGWGVLELVALRLARREADSVDLKGDSGHSERQ